MKTPTEDFVDNIMAANFAIQPVIHQHEIDHYSAFLLVRAEHEPWRPCEIYNQPGISDEKSRSMAVSLGTRVEYLEKMGYVERKRDVVGDRRAVRVHLTDAGLDVVMDIRNAMAEALGGEEGVVEGLES